MTQDFSIKLESISKRYDMQWIFRNLDYSFHFGRTYAIRGYNGSGKSTLLRILSTMESPSNGKRTYTHQNKLLAEADVSSFLSFCAPYMSVPDHLSVLELIQFHGNFKDMTMTHEALLDDLKLAKTKGKRFEQLSSGQKQKVKLALAICNSDPFLLLDEPGTNLDDHNYAWFTDKIRSVANTKLICIATNESRDLEICNESVLLSEMN